MIISFGDKVTQTVWNGERVKNLPVEVLEVTRRKLRMLNNSVDLKDLLIPPSNRLEKFKGSLKDHYSIRVNNQYRIVFRWENGHTQNVRLMDYH